MKVRYSKEDRDKIVNEILRIIDFDKKKEDIERIKKYISTGKLPKSMEKYTEMSYDNIKKIVEKFVDNYLIRFTTSDKHFIVKREDYFKIFNEEAEKAGFKLQPGNEKYKEEYMDKIYLYEIPWGDYEQKNRFCKNLIKRLRENKIAISPEDLINKIKEYYKDVSKNPKITINFLKVFLNSILEKGKYLSLFDVIEEYGGEDAFFERFSLSSVSDHFIGEYKEKRKRLETPLIFNGAYPVYGALIVGIDNKMKDSKVKELKEAIKESRMGGAIGYGRAYLVLDYKKVKDRIIFSHGDSYRITKNPKSNETPPYLIGKHAFLVKAMGLLETELSEKGYAHIFVYNDNELPEMNRLSVSRNISTYIEAQILGGVKLKKDVEEINVPKSLLDAIPEKLRQEYKDLLKTRKK